MSQPPTTDFDARAETWNDAGTGLLSFCLRDALGPITLVDSSAGMRAVAERKIAAANARDMRVIDLDLMRDPVPDVVWTQATEKHRS